MNAVVADASELSGSGVGSSVRAGAGRGRVAGPRAPRGAPLLLQAAMQGHLRRLHLRPPRPHLRRLLQSLPGALSIQPLQVYTMLI